VPTAAALNPINAMPQPQNVRENLRITLVFPQDGTPDIERDLALSFDQVNWYGNIAVSLPLNGQTITSPQLSVALRSWGLPAAFDSVESRGGINAKATYLVQSGNRVVNFYNDASVDAEGTQGAFADIRTAIDQAQHFIFIADWSFHPDTYLRRSPQRQPDPNDRIGMILINKARQERNMVIAIHTWYHVDSGLGPIQPDDVKNNNGGDRLDEMCGGQAQRPPNLLWRMTERSGILWSHHQKFVVLDAPVDPTDLNGLRELKVFFGGLDLTTGRFDWPDHRAHYDTNDDRFFRFVDWYNPEFATQVKDDLDNNRRPPRVPRQPWHDIHAQLIGRAAWDIMREFVGRWNASGTFFSSQGRSFRPESQLDNQGRVWQKFVNVWLNQDIMQPYIPLNDPRYPQPQSRPWTVQVCRSMEEKFWAPPDNAIKRTVPAPQQGMSEALSEEMAWSIQHKKNPRGPIRNEFEKSIHKAYLQAIKRANDFIYIETQYLIGESAFKTNSTNRIPKAIVDRILEINGANAQRDFHVYIVTPLYPEGDPLGTPVQPVRYNQWATMKWMRDELTGRLPQGGKQWEDYLSFYFLGQRHGAVNPNNGDRAARIENSNRYMIYVHSKLMIVDDRWIILGSANLNERSMAGNRDSEICVAMWPTPGHPDANVASTKIKDFRKELWREHLTGSPNFNTLQQNHFDTPEAANTVTAIRTAAQHNFNEFCQDAAPTNMGHLMCWNWTAIDTGYMPDSPPGEAKLLWAAQAVGAPINDDGFR